MPLFRRPDGDPLRGEAPVRRILPYLMPGRNESAVYHQSVYDVGRARVWLKRYNQTHTPRATLFHLFTHACGRALHERPGLNRFVSGSRLYQRRGVFISFAVKRELKDESPFTTIKLEMPQDDPFERFLARVQAAIVDGRSDNAGFVDKELDLVLRLPGPILRLGVRLVRWLDRVNLLPRFMMKNDPMYASLFLANLGSVGVSDAFHHLYEYGTVSVFGVLSAPTRLPSVDKGQIVTREVVRVNWTFDERINDGFYCARSLAVAQAILEDPERHLGAPDGPPGSSPPRPPST